MLRKQLLDANHLFAVRYVQQALGVGINLTASDSQTERHQLLIRIVEPYEVGP